MGQAKVRREARRQQMLDEGRKWDFQPSSWEADICAELKDDSLVVVAPRAAAEQIAWMKMPANKCHANVRWFVRDDPSKRARAVPGW